MFRDLIYDVYCWAAVLPRFFFLFPPTFCWPTESRRLDPSSSDCTGLACCCICMASNCPRSVAFSAVRMLFSSFSTASSFKTSYKKAVEICQHSKPLQKRVKDRKKNQVNKWFTLSFSKYFQIKYEGKISQDKDEKKKSRQYTSCWRRHILWETKGQSLRCHTGLLCKLVPTFTPFSTRIFVAREILFDKK